MYWTPFLDGLEETLNCGGEICLVTNDRKYRNSPALKAYMFYGSHLSPTDFPLPRRSNDLWALYHEESPKNIPLLAFNNTISIFNLTSTFSRNSHIPLTLQHLHDLADIFDLKHYQSVGDKNLIQRQQNLAPILYLQSSCDTLSDRDQYVAKLKKFIPIDCYGRCLKNKQLPDDLDHNYLDKLESDELMRFIAKYKFMITYENAVCDDYISEKLWRALQAGVVPIYFGSPTIRDWLPYPKAAILISDFASPKALADYIHKLDSHNGLYYEYQAHKTTKGEPITNKHLLHRVYKEYFISSDHLRDFECTVCTFKKQKVTAPLNSYNCMLKYPKGIKPRTRSMSTILEYYQMGRCEALAMQHLLERNQNFTKEEYKNRLHDLLYKENMC